MANPNSVLPTRAVQAPAAGEDCAGRRLTLPRIFNSELRTMMYGFGDSANPRPDTVKLMEELVLHYVEQVVTKTTEVAQSYRRERPDVNDVLFVIRKDKRKLNRVRYLLDMKAEIKRATAIDAEKLTTEEGGN